ncbi:hypothetical protein T439DRAFT_320530 [Meredithblackwellia eburnea MCA 4105]
MASPRRRSSKGGSSPTASPSSSAKASASAGSRTNDPHPFSGSKFTEDHIIQVKMLMLQGWSRGAIAEKLNMSTNSVGRFMRHVVDNRAPRERLAREVLDHERWEATARERMKELGLAVVTQSPTNPSPKASNSSPPNRKRTASPAPSSSSASPSKRSRSSPQSRPSPSTPSARAGTLRSSSSQPQMSSPKPSSSKTVAEGGNVRDEKDELSEDELAIVAPNPTHKNKTTKKLEFSDDVQVKFFEQDRARSGSEDSEDDDAAEKSETSRKGKGRQIYVEVTEDSEDDEEEQDEEGVDLELVEDSEDGSTRRTTPSLASTSKSSPPQSSSSSTAHKKPNIVPFVQIPATRHQSPIRSSSHVVAQPSQSQPKPIAKPKPNTVRQGSPLAKTSMTFAPIAPKPSSSNSTTTSSSAANPSPLSKSVFSATPSSEGPSGSTVDEKPIPAGSRGWIIPPAVRAKKELEAKQKKEKEEREARERQEELERQAREEREKAEIAERKKQEKAEKERLRKEKVKKEKELEKQRLAAEASALEMDVEEDDLAPKHVVNGPFSFQTTTYSDAGPESESDEDEDTNTHDQTITNGTSGSITRVYTNEDSSSDKSTNVLVDLLAPLGDNFLLLAPLFLSAGCSTTSDIRALATLRSDELRMVVDDLFDHASTVGLGKVGVDRDVLVQCIQQH